MFSSVPFYAPGMYEQTQPTVNDDSVKKDLSANKCVELVCMNSET